MSMAAFGYIRRYYGVPAKRGGRIRYGDKAGKFIWTCGPYITVRLDNSRQRLYIHPTDPDLEYLGDAETG